VYIIYTQYTSFLWLCQELYSLWWLLFVKIYVQRVFVFRHIYLYFNANTTYYFNVVVKDSKGNRAAYTSASESTTPLTEIVHDITPPTPGGGATVTTSNPTTTTIDVYWTKGSDDTSAQANLEYLVYYSKLDNINTVAQMESNGTAAGSYSADISSKTVTELTAATGYYFIFEELEKYTEVK